QHWAEVAGLVEVLDADALPALVRDAGLAPLAGAGDMFFAHGRSQQRRLANRSFLGVENPQPFLYSQVGGPFGRVRACWVLGVDAALAVEGQGVELLEEKRNIERTVIFDQLPSACDEIVWRREESSLHTTIS